MRILSKFALFPVVVLFLFTLGCSSDNEEKGKSKTEVVTKNVTQEEPLNVSKETTLLLKDLSENGDYVNGREFPSLIKVSSVHDLIGNNIHLIDIRSAQEYSEGHIQEAVNVSFSDLPEYFESGIKPFEYDRIILISADGQASSYTTSLLRLMGYGNLFSMRWGMSGWNDIYAEKGWFAACKSDFQNQLEEKVNEKPVGKGMPVLNTGKSTGEQVGLVRFEKLFSEGLDNVMVNAADVFLNPQNYYIINYDRRDKYESGHIPGAIRYKPGATLSIVEEMATIPSDKIVVIYCGTGHNSGFVTAYLRLFGYDARTLKYGNNGFMYDRMVEDRATLSWLPFTNSDVNDYKVVK